MKEGNDALKKVIRSMALGTSVVPRPFPFSGGKLMRLPGWLFRWLDRVASKERGRRQRALAAEVQKQRLALEQWARRQEALHGAGECAPATCLFKHDSFHISMQDAGDAIA